LRERACEGGDVKYKQYCPVARASEILADRWTPLIVRELLAGSCHFNQIERGLPGMSRTLLAARLRALEDADVLVRRVGASPHSTEYHLTRAGEDLQHVIDAFGRWAARWAFGEPRPEELDPVLLLWKMHRRINRHLLPGRRVVVEFEFTNSRPSRLWLVLEPREVSVCLKPPGFDSDLIVKADLADFYFVWLGHTSLGEAERAGRVSIEGPPTLARYFPRWPQWSPMAQEVRAAASVHRLGRDRST
jgi:DNA-binding HxlR family transcriptional regulator